MNYIIDIILLGILVLSTFVGYKRGLIKVAFHLISFFLAIFVAIILYKPISTFVIDYTPLDDKIEEAVEEKLSSNISQDEIDNLLSNYYSSVKHASTHATAQTISNSIINISCILIVFFATQIVLLLFKFSGDLIAKLPLIKQCNHAGGFLYGLLQGFVMIYILLALVAILAPFVDMNRLLSMINSSIIANIMYNHNILFVLFT